jgi:hypothetical protein
VFATQRAVLVEIGFVMLVAVIVVRLYLQRLTVKTLKNESFEVEVNDDDTVSHNGRDMETSLLPTRCLIRWPTSN